MRNKFKVQSAVCTKYLKLELTRLTRLLRRMPRAVLAGLASAFAALPIFIPFPSS